MESNESKLHYMQISVDHMEMTKYLTNEQCGLLFKSTFAYFRGEKSDQDIENEAQKKHQIILPVFAQLKMSIDRGRSAYEERCAKNRENGRKGGAPKGNQNARKKKGNIKDEEEHTPQTKETEEDNTAEEDEDSLSDEEIILLSEKVQNMVKRMETELSVYNTSLFKYFTKKQAIKFLSCFITSYDMSDIIYSDNISFDLWYKNGALGFLNDFKDYCGSDPTKFLKEFEKDVKEAYLDESDRATIDGYYQDLKINERILTNVIK